MKWWYENAPGLYDDIYMDLTFVEVFDRVGLDAPADSFAQAFARAEYSLWHANQMARYNILQGMTPPASGHWLNNTEADDIDFQIEADFAGLMSPGMPQTANVFADKVGHIMNYGDGVYGGMFVAGLYAHAFIEDDISKVVRQALRSIPAESDYAKAVQDVIDLHAKYPTNCHSASVNGDTHICCPISSNGG